MAKGCSVCRRDDIANVNAMLVAGKTLREISQRFGITKSTLDRHKKNCLGTPAAAPTTNGRKVNKSRNGVNLKRERFVQGILAGKNGTQAAQDAGYAQASADVQASRLLRDARIQERIRRWVELGTEIQAREILGRLGDRARADITELLDEHGRFDLVDIRNRGLGHLIKSVTVRQERTNPGARDEEPRYADVIRIELHDGQKSDEILGKYLGMERTPVNLSVNVSLDEQRQVNFLVRLVKRLHAQAQSEGDPISVEGVLDQVIEWEKQYQDKDLKSLKPIVLQRLSDGSFRTVERSVGPGDGSVTADGTGDGCIEQSA